MEASDEELLEVAAVVRRYLTRRTRDTHLVEDLTQETLVGVAAARPRLSGDELRAYSVATARNLLVGQRRADAMHSRHVHRLVEYRGLAGPERLTLEREETDALARALDRLDPEDRELLLAHEADDVSIPQLAERRDVTPATISTRLARARARLRVEFVLAFRNVGPLPSRCRQVLVAMSSGDARRQEELDAASHVESCPTCASLAKPIAQRRRGIALWLLLVPIGRGAVWVARRLRDSRLAQGVAVATVSAASVALYVGLRHPDTHPPARAGARPPVTATTAPPPPSPSPTSSVLARRVATNPCTTSSAIDRSRDGCPLVLSDRQVAAVPADEGFWLSAPDGAAPPLWVHLIGPGESPEHVMAGAHVRVAGRIRALPSDLATTGAPARLWTQLRQRSAYVEVPYAALTVVG